MFPRNKNPYSLSNFSILSRQTGVYFFLFFFLSFSGKSASENDEKHEGETVHT